MFTAFKTRLENSIGERTNGADQIPNWNLLDGSFSFEMSAIYKRKK